MQDATRTDRREARAWIVGAGIAVVVGTVLLLGLSALPAVCPAIDPTPPSCAPGARVPYAVAGVAAVLIVYAVSVVVALRASRDRRSPALSLFGVVLGAVFAAGVAATLFAGGFII